MDQKAFLRTDEIVCSIAEPEWCSLYITLEISETGLSLICSLYCVFWILRKYFSLMSFCFSLNVICLGKVRQFLQSRVHLEELFCLFVNYRILFFPRKFHLWKFSDPVFLIVVKILNISNLKNNNLQDCCPAYQFCLSSYTIIWQPNTHTV